MPNARTEVRRPPAHRTLLAPRCVSSRSGSASSEDSATVRGAGAEEEWEEEGLRRTATSQEAARVRELCGGDPSASPAAHLRRLGRYFLPEWVASYRWELLPFDVVAGVTITTIVVPQCVAYAILANLPAEYGLYSSVIPVLVYSLLGTSHSVHVGTFALTSLLVGSSVTSILNRAVQNNPSGGLLRAENGTFVYHWDAPLDNLRRNGDRDPGVDAALMLTVIVGCTQLLAAVCFLGGVVGRLIPDEVVSGFTSSSAVHIVTSQVRSLTGQPIPSYTGPLSLFKTWWHALTTLHRTHAPTLAFGCLSASLLIGIQIIDRLRNRQQAVTKKTEQRQTDVEDGNVSPFQEDLQVIVDNPFAQAGPRKSPQMARESPWSSQRLESQDGVLRLIGSTTSAHGRIDGLPALVDAAATSAERAPEKKFPVPDILIVVVAATTASWALSASDLGIRVLGSIPTGLRGFSNPVSADIVAATGGDFLTTLAMFLPSAVGLSVVSYVMSIAIVKAFSAPSQDAATSPPGPAPLGDCQGNFLPFSSFAASDSPTPPSPTTPTTAWDFAGNAATDAVPPLSSQDLLPYNRELLALGAASTVGSAFGAYVCTGSLTRSAVLRSAGGRTPLASVISALGVTACCFLLAPLMAAIPLCSLAAVIVVTCGKLVGQARDFAVLWRAMRDDGEPEGKCGGRRADAAMWAVVFVVVIIGGVDLGVGVMMASAALRNLATWIRNFRAARYERRDI